MNRMDAAGKDNPAVVNTPSGTGQGLIKFNLYSPKPL
jgi:hypothetical protein